MTRYHDRTLALLGDEGARPARCVAILTDWAEANDITLPAAFLEWAGIDDGSLLGKYSNDDWFLFDRPEVVTTPDGVRGLRFNSENQNNFDRIVVLDEGDDPPVLFAWLGEPPWVTNAERFSDAVFAQVFDWQYWLDFRPDDPEYKEIAYTGEISLETDACLQLLRRRYEETVATRFIVEGDRSTEYRFVASPTLRLTVAVAGDRSTVIRATGRPIDRVKEFEDELTSLLAGDGAA
ncbi:hypothetical protein [Paludisphaera sp.]|uniref:hypothetical protein n=1 Tax=Paludisphaera sp. TaxID=2017432 RepID=UPI00301C2E5D